MERPDQPWVILLLSLFCLNTVCMSYHASSPESCTRIGNRVLVQCQPSHCQVLACHSVLAVGRCYIFPTLFPNWQNSSVLPVVFWSDWVMQWVLSPEECLMVKKVQKGLSKLEKFWVLPCSALSTGMKFLRWRFCSFWRFIPVGGK